MKHLLFDFGGVLVDLDKQRCIAAFQELGFDITPFLGTYRQAGIFSQFERGEVNEQEFCQSLRNLMEPCAARIRSRYVIYPLGTAIA